MHVYKQHYYIIKDITRDSLMKKVHKKKIEKKRKNKKKKKIFHGLSKKDDAIISSTCQLENVKLKPFKIVKSVISNFKKKNRQSAI